MLNLPIKILQTIQIETAQASVTFGNINTLVAAWDAAARVTSRHLVIIANARSPDAVAERVLEVQFNGDAANNYHWQELNGTAAAATANRQTVIDHLEMGRIPGTTYPNAWGGGMMLVPHAFGTVDFKAVLTLGGGAENDVAAWAGHWAVVNAITSVLIQPDTGNFLAGSTFHLGVVDERYLVEEFDFAAAAGRPIWDNIPQGEGDLVIVGYGRSTQAAVEDEILHYINDDAVLANYPAIELLGRGAGAPTSAAVNGEIAMLIGQNGLLHEFGAMVISYSQYTKANQPHFLSLSGYVERAVGPTSEVRLMSGRRANIEPINKIELDPTLGINFLAGSLFSLYRVPKRIIERQVLTAAQATITFANIPQNFEALVLHVYAKTDRVAGSDPVEFEINGDAVAGNYQNQQLYGFGGAVTAVRNANDINWLLISGTLAALANVNEFDGGTLLFPGYAETDRHKHAIGLYGNSDNSIFIQSARWASLNAITSIAITPLNGPNFQPGTIVELEGILRREGLPAIEGMSVD